QDLRLLAAAAAGVQQPVAPRRRPAALELLLHPVDVNVVVEAVAALALELAQPARQPLDGEAAANLGDVVGDLDQPRHALLDGVAPRAGLAAERPPQDADGVFFSHLGQFDITPALGAGEFFDQTL